MLLIFESHPVQYRVPLYQELHKRRPGSFKVIYGARHPGFDKEFGKEVTWDRDLFDGYEYRILNNLRGPLLSSFFSLGGAGVFQLLRDEKPCAVLLTTLNYWFGHAVYYSALFLGIPVCLRMETSDVAYERSTGKNFLRSLIYRVLYSGISHALYIGENNREHLLRHGVGEDHLFRSPYSVPNPFISMDAEDKQKRRDLVRERLGIEPGKVVVGFFGKLIAKKDPGLLLRSVDCLSDRVRSALQIVFVGTGELEESLKRDALAVNCATSFAGFVNQSEIGDYYLMADIMALPSLPMGETWGLVVNEGLQAGCSILVSDAVGSHREFGSWERVETIPGGDARACAKAIEDLFAFERSFEWCAERMEGFSISASVCGYERLLDKLNACPEAQTV